MSALDETVRARLLRVVRATLERELSGTGDCGVDPKPWPELERCGVFVTLRTGGRLRGCIGTFNPEGDLPDTVERMTRATLDDPRFVDSPLSASDLGEVRIELSILSQRCRLADPLSLQLGTHGIQIVRDGRSGCYLPQVAAEQGWDVETYLSHCCAHKAGLPADAWRDKNTEVFIFTVEKIAEG